MASIPLEDLLHKTIRDLHALHLFSVDQSEAEYESLLLETIQSILRLLNYESKYYKCVSLGVSPGHSDIGPLSFLYYIDKQHTSALDKPFSSTNIIQFIQSSGNEQSISRPYVISQLLRILSRHNKNNDRKPVRLKESYSLVLLKFSELVEFFAKFYSESESRLIEYLNRCFTRELKFFSNLRNRLDEELSLGYEETEKIVEILDSFISIPENSDDSDHIDENDVSEANIEKDDSIFSYDDEHLEHEPSPDPGAMTPLGFEATDQTFSRIYQVFVQICGLKNEQGNDDGEIRNHREYLKLLIGFYKKHNNVESLEINDFKFREIKFNFFYQFLMGKSDDSEHSLLPFHFKNSSQRVISKLDIFPEMNNENDYSEHVSNHKPPYVESSQNIHPEILQRRDSEGREPQALLSSSFLGHESFSQPEEPPSFVSFLEYTREDQIELFLGLGHIIPLLNEFDLNFDPSYPLVFRHYMKLLYEDIPESSEQADFEYIERIVTLVNTITDFENADDSQDNLDIKDTVFSFYDEHQKLMGGERVQDAQTQSRRTLLMKLAAHEFAASHNTKKQVLYNWNYKTLYLGQLQYNLVNKFEPISRALCQRLYLKQWFGKLQRFKTLETVSSTYSQNRIQVKFLRDHWVPSLILIGNGHIAARKFFLRRFFDSWLAMSRQKLDQAKTADLYDTKRRTAQSLTWWIQRFNGIIELQSRADATRELGKLKTDRQVSKFVLRLWYNKMNVSHLALPAPSSQSAMLNKNQLSISNDQARNSSDCLSHKLLTLGTLESRFIKQKFFNKWNVTYCHGKILVDVMLKNERSLLKYILKEKWIKNYKVSMKGHDLVHKKESEMKAQTLLSWKRCASLRKSADSFYQTNVISKIIKRWKQRALHSYILRTDGIRLSNEHKLKQYLKKWTMAHSAKTLENQRSHNLMMRIHQTWIEKTASYKQNHAVAVNADISLLSSKYLYSWLRNYRLKEKLQDAADLNFQRKFFNHLLAVRHHYAVDYKNVADHVAGNGLSFEARLTLATAYRRWKQEYARRFEILTQKKVIYFKKKVMDPSTKFTFLTLWVAKYNANCSRRTELDARHHKFMQNSKKKGELFQKWFGRANEIRALSQKSAEFEAYLLYKKLVVIWYDQLVNKVIYLNEVAEDFTSKNEYVTVRDALSRWSMKYIKTNRNQQTCEMFLRRWEASKAKSILELWLQKTQERSNNAYLLADVSNSSITTNQSPLASKSSRSNESDQIVNDEMSYLYTPVKSQVTRSPATPFRRSSKNISPSKLLETNRKIKAERLESLRSHFSKAKGHSTPTKKIQPLINSLAESTSSLTKPSARMVRLSPPRRESPSNPVVPPRAPIFATSRVSVGKAPGYAAETFMDDDDYRAGSRAVGPSRIFTDEENEIESAKKLKRITPIFIPPENDEEPRFSPVRKLKERLRYNMALSENESSNDIFS